MSGAIIKKVKGEGKHHNHDSYDEHGYKKRCHCTKCKRTYDEWCRKHKEEGCATCKRKCYTVCEIVCEKPHTVVTEWGYKKEYEGKWEKYDHIRPPKNCDKHKKPNCGECGKH
jgi:hypothetical protein